MWTYAIIGLGFLGMVALTTYSLLKKSEAETDLARLRALSESRWTKLSEDTEKRVAANKEEANRHVADAEKRVAAIIEASTRQLAIGKEAAERQVAKSEAKVEAARQELAKLDRIRHIPDIIEKASKAKEEIAVRLDRASEKAGRIVEVATEKANEILAQANAKIDLLQMEAGSRSQGGIVGIRQL